MAGERTIHAWAIPGAMLVLGLATGWFAARRTPAPAVAPPATTDWIARIDGHYIDAAEVVEEMRRRGGERAGLFQDAASRRALIDELLLRQALVQAARDAGLDQEADTRRAIEQLLVTRYLDGSLREAQRGLRVDSNEVAAYYEEHAAEYAVPARRRVAMLRIDVPAGAPDAAWQAAEARAAEALRRTRELQPPVADFGPVAIDYSSDQATRYRGGSLGWLTDARRDTYAHDPALRDAAFALQSPGEFSPVVRGADAVYVARLVERQDARPRPLADLRAGIEQMLLQQRYAQEEDRFREDALSRADIEVREDRLATLEPLGPPAPDAPVPPPAVPGEQEPAP